MSNPFFNFNSNIIPVASQTMTGISSVLAIGNPIIDITANIEKELIQKYGLKWGETVFSTPENETFF